MSKGRGSSRSRAFYGALALIGLVALAGARAGFAHDEPTGRPHHKGIPANPTAVMRAFMNDTQAVQSQLAIESDVLCSDGFAGDFPCHGVDLLAFMPLTEIGGTHIGSAANDIWGWTDPLSDREYALIGRVFGTSFVDVTDPKNPVYLGELFTHDSVGSSWRDIKVYQDHAFIVSEASGHGIQVLDLRQLPALDPAGAPYDLSEAAHYAGFGRAHNLVINEATGFAYAVGVREAAPNTCSSGLHMIDISDPVAPVYAGCFSADGYTHDAQCVAYAGPDPDHQGKEICFASNEDTLTIVDVTNKGSPAQISRTGYAGDGYTHQAWLSEDQTLLFLDDELDERNFGHGTKTRTWDISDLDNPWVLEEFVNVTAAIDHNLYVKGGLIYQANYRAGLAILEILRDSSGNYVQLDERAYFDVYPSSDSANFNGAWSNYPYFPSGTVVVSGIEQGLFVLGLDLPDEVDFVSPTAGATVSGSEVVIDILARDGNLDAVAPTVTWRVDGLPQANPTAAEANHFLATWDSTTVGDGLHSLRAEMIDAASNPTSATILVDVRNSDDPPAVSFIAPQDGDPVSGNITLQASADDDGTVMSLAFYDDGAKIGDASLSGSVWSLRWNTKKAGEGAHTVMAQAMDDGGQPGEASIGVTVGGGGNGPGGGGGPGGPKCHPKRDPDCER